MKKIRASCMMFAFLAHFLHASAPVASVDEPIASQSPLNISSASASVLYRMMQQNPHVMIGLALFMSRPLLGLITQAEEYSLARLAGLSIVSDQYGSQAVVNLGALGLHAVTLTNDQVQQAGILSFNCALQEVQDPATSGSAHAISIKTLQKSDSKNQNDSQSSQNIPDLQGAQDNLVEDKSGQENSTQDNPVDDLAAEIISQGLQDALAGNVSNPALVESLQDTIEGNAVWGLHVSANIGNYGVRGTIALSDVVVSVLGALAVLALQAASPTASLVV